MDVNQPGILFGRVMHARLHPARNEFSYPIYYLTLPMTARDLWPVAVNRWAPLSFYDRDHGARDGTDPTLWCQKIFADHNVSEINNITLFTLPRIMGYVFNPVSFWVARDGEGNVRAVLCEVNNTFGDTHSYVCLPAEGATFTKDTITTTAKVFHVSPFLPREGSYEFRFALDGPRVGFWIDYLDRDGRKQLVTALTGAVEPMTKARLRRAFWTYPLVTWGAIFLIHYQALKLFLKRQRFYRRPTPVTPKISRTLP